MTQVFDQTQFKNIPTAVRAKLNVAVEAFKKPVLIDVGTCKHREESLKMTRSKSGIVKKITCICGKEWKY